MRALEEIAALKGQKFCKSVLFIHTLGGNHTRRPFGRGWMTAERWEQIKDDPSQWSEEAARQRYFETVNL